MNPHAPAVRWTGETFALHLRMIDGTNVLFAGDKMLDGVFSLTVYQDLGDNATRVTVQLYVEPPPEELP